MKLQLATVTLLAGLGLGATAAAAPVTHDLVVKGAAHLEFSSVEVKLVVRRGAKDKVRIVADLSGGIMGKPELDIDQDGGAIDLGGLDPSVRGTVTVDLPPGSSLEAESVTGGVTASGIARVEIENVTGAIKVDGADQVDIESVNGSVEVTGGRRHRIETVNGGITLTTAGLAPDVELATVNGAVKLRGACGKGCRIRFESVSGQARLELDKKTSSFEVRFESFSGRLDDQLGLTAGGRRPRRELEGTYGKGEGSIEGESFSGLVTLAPAGG